MGFINSLKDVKSRLVIFLNSSQFYQAPFFLVNHTTKLELIKYTWIENNFNVQSLLILKEKNFQIKSNAP